VTPIAIILLILAFGVVFYGLSRLSSITVREITIPFAEGNPPREEVKAALERMGCVVSDNGSGAVTGLHPGRDFSWGQQVTVTTEPRQLRVRSCFSNSQAFGGEKNQENIDRFRAEWERRADFRAAMADPAVRASSEARAREVARNGAWGGSVAVAAGLALLLLALFVPSEGSRGSRLKLLGLALLPLAYGLPRVSAALARLRKKAGG
jgi:hypothetical protein